MLIDLVRMALRLNTSAFDIELNSLIEAAKRDLGIAGVELSAELDDIVNTAIITYVKLHFGEPDEYDRLKASYDEQKAQLSMASGYTVWTDPA